MSQPLLRGALRGIAIAIAVAALVDPVLTVERMPDPPTVLINMTTGDAAPVARELARLDATSGVNVRPVDSDRLPCGPGEHCIMLADGSRNVEFAADLTAPLSLIKKAQKAGPNVRLRAVAISAAQHAAAAGAAQVLVDGTGVAGKRTTITIADGSAVVGTATIEWKADGAQSVDVPWWPMGSGPRSLRVEVATEGDASGVDDVIDAGVDVGSERLPVLVYDARPSWGSAFVRRTLEDDRRFLVEHRARLAPAISAGTVNGRLDARALDTAAVLIVGGPDALTAGEVDVIERFVRVRGGTLILLPERAPTGSVARLFDGTWAERLSEDPQAVGSLRASELLVYPPEGGHHEVLAEAGGTPTIVATPLGAGRVIVSGAMDAWRYRDTDNGAFDRFWRSVVVEGAAAGLPLRLDFENAIGVPGSRQPFLLRSRRMLPVSTIEASAVARCGADLSAVALAEVEAFAIRLWPAGAPGVMRGELPARAHESCTVEAAIDDARVTRGIAVHAAPSRGVDATLASIEQHVRASGGVVTDEDNLVRLRPFGATSRQAADVWPMRSAWWMVPFAFCLSAEWWLRRRTGLR